MNLTHQIEKYFDRLWPINRSITGNGLRDSFEILKEIIPLTTYEVASNTKVHDWVVPPEWYINEAYIITPSGKKIADFSTNNLHIVGYSLPFEGKMNFDELDNHLHTLPNQPDAIPYITSYYNPTWGFCISHNQYLELDKEGEYIVKIDAKLQEGSLTMGDLVLEGESEEEVVFSSYLCHPSLASNELSGPLVLAMLYQQVKSIPNRRYTYRFVIAPETIGTITYLSRKGKQMKEKCIAGLVITCVGDAGEFTYKMSKEKNSNINKICIHLLTMLFGNRKKIEPFSPIGSDERQFCSPGYNLPFGSLMRTMYGKYPQYHTSLDNKDYISFQAMSDTVELYTSVVKVFEMDGYYINKKPHCEPQLGKRGLYPTIGDKSEKSSSVKKIMYMLNYGDGKHTLLDIANMLEINILDMKTELQSLMNAGLLERVRA